MVAGLALALRSALGTNVAFLFKQRGALLAPPLRACQPLRSAVGLLRGDRAAGPRQGVPPPNAVAGLALALASGHTRHVKSSEESLHAVAADASRRLHLHRLSGAATKQRP